jgi:ribosomal-protein-alanine N-acetyltransferase
MATMEDEDVLVRWMIRRDIPTVLDIERESFEDPWTEKELLKYLQERTHIGMVAVIADDVVGFMLYDLQAQLVKIDSIAVDKTCRRSGIGSCLLAKIRAKLTQQRSLIRTMVREKNLQALAFFRSSGFVATELVRRPFRDSTEDGYLLEFERGTRRLSLTNRITTASQNFGE